MSTTKRDPSPEHPIIPQIAPKRRGVFITFEGGDGCGKTTQMHLLAEHLRGEGHSVLESVEPGGTRIGEQIRRVLLDPANQELCAIPEVLLYFASRAQNVEELILPALEQGTIVLVDRFTDSSMAYQGYGRGLGEDVVIALDRIACRGLIPDITILIDIDPDTGLQRARERAETNRMDDQARDFHNTVRKAYLRMAGREPRRFRVIDGACPVVCVADAIWDAVSPLVTRIDV